MKKCTKHNWRYVHTVWDGRNNRKDEIGVVRYCDTCRKREAAFTSNWGPIPKSHPDMKQPIDNF